MKRYLVSAVAILGILLSLVLSTLDIITSRTLFFLLGGVFGGIGLLILVGKQYYLVAGIPIIPLEVEIIQKSRSAKAAWLAELPLA